MAALGPNLNPINPPNPNGIQPPVEHREVNVVNEKLAEATNRQLAKNILSGTMSRDRRELQTKSLDKHTFKALKNEVKVRQEKLEKKEATETKTGRAVNMASHLFQRFKNFMMAGGRFKTDAQLLDMASKKTRPSLEMSKTDSEGRPIREGFQLPMGNRIRGMSTTRLAKQAPIAEKGAEYERFGRTERESLAFKAQRKVAHKALEPTQIENTSLENFFKGCVTEALAAVAADEGRESPASFNKLQVEFLDDCLSQIIDEFRDSGEPFSGEWLAFRLKERLLEGNTKKDSVVREDWKVELTKMTAHMTPAERARLNREYNARVEGTSILSWKPTEERDFTWFIFPEYGEIGKGDFVHKLSLAQKVMDKLCSGEKFLERVQAEIGFENPEELHVSPVQIFYGNIAENQFPGKKTVVVNSANTKLEWGRGGTNRALSEVISKKSWEAVHGHTSHRPFARTPDRIVVGEAVIGPKISDGFEMIQALGPRLDAKTTVKDLHALQMEVYEAYSNALQLAKEQGAECVQVPQFCTGSFMRDAPPDVKQVWPDMVNTAFLLAVEMQNSDGAMQVAMVIPEGATAPDFDAAAEKTATLREGIEQKHDALIAGMRNIAASSDMVAFYKDGPTACFGNFATVPGGFVVGTSLANGVRFYNVEAAFQHAKAMHAMEIGREKAKSLGEDPLFRELQLCKTGDEALRLGRALENKYPALYAASAPDWHNGVKQEAMFVALRAKFAIEPFRSLLTATGDTYLLEHKASSKARDNYWSDGGSGEGVNALGQMLMAIRGGGPRPELVINPNIEGYEPNSEIKKHARTANEGLGYTIYGFGPESSVGRPAPRAKPTAEDARQALLEKANQGDATAQFEVGMLYRLEDPELSQQYLEEAAANNPELAENVDAAIRNLEFIDLMPSDEEYSALEEPMEERNQNWVKFQESYARLQPDNTSLDQLKEGLVQLERFRREERPEADRVKLDEMDGMIAALKSRIEVTEQNLPPLEVRQEQAQVAFKDFRQLYGDFNRFQDVDSLKNALADLKALRGKCGPDLNTPAQLQEMNAQITLAENFLKRVTVYHELKAVVEGKINAIRSEGDVESQNKQIREFMQKDGDFQRMHNFELNHSRVVKGHPFTYARELIRSARPNYLV